jgi:hypothetical protein
MTDSGFTDDMDAPVELGASTEVLLAAPEMWGEPPPGLDDRILTQIESEAAPFTAPASREPSPSRRHVPSMVLGAAAAVLVVFVAVIGFSVLDGGGGNEVLAVDLTPTGVVPDVSGSVEMEETDSGVRIDLRAEGLPRRIDGAYYEAWLRTSTGELVPVGTFHDGVDVVLWGGVSMAEVEAFSITQEGIESRDESGPRSSGSVVLKADIPIGP